MSLLRGQGRRVLLARQRGKDVFNFTASEEKCHRVWFHRKRFIHFLIWVSLLEEGSVCFVSGGVQRLGTETCQQLEGVHESFRFTHCFIFTVVGFETFNIS